MIGGFTEPEGVRASVGALLVGYYEDGALMYAGKVGRGKRFTREFLTRLRTELDGIIQIVRRLPRLGRKARRQRTYTG